MSNGLDVSRYVLFRTEYPVPKRTVAVRTANARWRMSVMAIIYVNLFWPRASIMINVNLNACSVVGMVDLDLEFV